MALIVSGTICLLATLGCALLAARQSGVRLTVDLRRGADRRLVVVHTPTVAHPGP